MPHNLRMHLTCYSGLRFTLRRDIDNLNLYKMPITVARARLSEQGFVCGKDYERYPDALLKSVYCTHSVSGFVCREDEHVLLEYWVDSGLVDRVTTGRSNTCL